MAQSDLQGASVGRPAGRRRSALALALASATLLVVWVAVAQAQSTDPYATAERQTTQNDLDTDHTPVAKESELFTLLHGAKFGKTEVIDESLTSFDTDLFDVSFRHAGLGLTVGSACSAPIERQSNEPDPAFGERIADCEDPDGTEHPRVPVAYLFTDALDGSEATWKKLTLPGGTQPGYVGAIAWIDQNRALLVGGTGAYPRREPPADGKAPTDPSKNDPAGKGRAWVFDVQSLSVSEVDVSTFTADEPNRAGMRGLTAVACHATEKLCFAGALGQIWEWRGAAFSGHHVDAKSPSNELERANLFRYRVRDISADGRFAVTAGCCSINEQENTPRVLAYSTRNTGEPHWDARNLYDRKLVGEGIYNTSRDVDDTRSQLTDRPALPDSLYAVSGAVTFIASPGGPEQPAEPASRIGSSNHASGPYTAVLGWADNASEYTSTTLATTRLLSADGHAVGELRSTERPGLGARGLVVSNIAKPAPQSVVNACALCPGADTVRPTPTEITEGWEPLDEEKLEQTIDSRHYFLPSYTANAVDMVAGGSDGWIVGDHGAIMRLSEKERQKLEARTEPKPPQLGSPREAAFSDRDAYERLRLPPAATAGVVPPFGAGLRTAEEPRMVDYGQVAGGFTGGGSLVMSRDGSEGWLIGNDSGGATFAQFDGSSWRPCDSLGIPGLVAPDPVCAKMAPLRGYRDSNGTFRTVQLIDAARVPLENDSDPTNDDELEIVAIGGFYAGPETDGRSLPVHVRYANGRWRFEPPRPDQPFGFDVAYTAPDDGWVMRTFGAGVVEEAAQRLYHFDGSEWHDCRRAPLKCDDPERRLPISAVVTGRGPSGLAVAGERIYAYGTRRIPQLESASSVPHGFPMIIYRDRGESWTDGWGGGGDRGGYDPAFADPAGAESGSVAALSVVQTPGGAYEGWAVGWFGTTDVPGNSILRTGVRPPAKALLMRLGPAPKQGWHPFHSEGPVEDYMHSALVGVPAPSGGPRVQLTYPSELFPDGTFITQLDDTGQPGLVGRGGRTFGFDAAQDRFELLESGRPQGSQLLTASQESRPAGTFSTMAPDGLGGFWGKLFGHALHYTRHVPRPVFEEVANPFGQDRVRLRTISASADGSVWAATDSDHLYRYERSLGWERLRIPGWEPGRIVIRASGVSALAVGPGGEGVAVGEGGRIANLSPAGVQLDPAAGRSCALAAPPPCGTSRDLRTVDIATDGSALAGGENMALLRRPPAGEFKAVAGPQIDSSSDIQAISYAEPDKAYLVTGAEPAGLGMVFRGELSASGLWRWRIENWVVPGERLNSVDAAGKPLAIRDIEVNAEGEGYAVGDAGLVLRRTRAGEWNRVPNPYIGNLTTVALPLGGGEGVLIGGDAGLILTGTGDELRIARPADVRGAHSQQTGPVAGLAYLPGTTEGSVDAWAALGSAVGQQGTFDRGIKGGDERLLRYRSEETSTALEPITSVEALGDSPPRDPDELAIAAFGKSDCDRSEQTLCPEFAGTTATNELINERITDELAARHRAGALDLAVHTGDSTDSAGLAGSSLTDLDRRVDAEQFVGVSRTQTTGQLRHRRFVEMVVDELAERGVPLFGAIGGQDLSEAFVCHVLTGCYMSKGATNGGDNLAWREAFAQQAKPWGNGQDLRAPQGALEFVPAARSEDGTLRLEAQRLDADGDRRVVEANADLGGASTHYAMDVLRDGSALARIVVVDSSLRSLAASDSQQQPLEPGGQIRFLERMLCERGELSATGDECTRAPDQKAVVVSNTPTYSYGPGALSHTATDGSLFESLMLRYDVDLVISGALGFNGVYYTLAPGIHTPCPGGEHPKAPPEGDFPDCIGPVGERPDASELLAEQDLSGVVPTLIASGAGGKFGPDGQAGPDGPAGRWHGYSVARLMPDGELIVEQRPILDWVGLDASEHTLGPRERLSLDGYGRSPISTESVGESVRALHYEISNAAITHRFDLLLADPEEPWVPCEAANVACSDLYERLAGTRSLGSATGSARVENCSPYICLPERIGTVDPLNGDVRAGSGKHPDTFAIAMLSVGDEVATWPLVFKRSPAFVAEPVGLAAPIPAAPGASPNAPQGPPPPSPPQPSVPQPGVPNIPVPPPVPLITASEPPEPQPPAPPAPPPPLEQHSPLSLTLSPPSIAIATPTAVIQPPTPPVNPAPPGGARREARQRQAATQKSGADSAEGGSEQGQVDIADRPPSSHAAEMTRLEHPFIASARGRPEPSFTPLARSEPSASGHALLYTSGGVLLAAIAAMGWTWGRPTPRRRMPEVPAPARAWAAQRRR